MQMTPLTFANMAPVVFYAASVFAQYPNFYSYNYYIYDYISFLFSLHSKDVVCRSSLLMGAEQCAVDSCKVTQR